MTILDTDIFTLLVAGQSRVAERFRREIDQVVLTLVSRIEVLEGRFASVIKAANGEELLRALRWLEQSERDLAKIPIISFDSSDAAAFEVLRKNKKLKKLGRGDLLIASIALGRRATLVTRNVRHFQQIPGIHLANWAD